MTLTSIAIAVAVALLVIALVRARARDGGSSDPDTATQADLRALLIAGRKIDAIKVYRRLHGVDLKAAKEAVDRMANELLPPPER